MLCCCPLSLSCHFTTKCTYRSILLLSLAECGETGVAFYVDLNLHHPEDAAARTSVPFGHYWFMIEGASWAAKGVVWRIRVIREVFQGDKTQAERCRHCGKYPDGDSANSTFNTTGSGGADGGGRDDPLNMTEIAQRVHRTLRENIRPAEWLEVGRIELELVVVTRD